MTTPEQYRTEGSQLVKYTTTETRYTRAGLQSELDILLAQDTALQLRIETFKELLRQCDKLGL